MTLDLRIGGSFTSPKVSVDTTKSMANQVVEAVADEAIITEWAENSDLTLLPVPTKILSNRK